LGKTFGAPLAILFVELGVLPGFGPRAAGRPTQRSRTVLDL